MVDTIHYTFRLREKYTVEKVPTNYSWFNNIYHPNGILLFSVGESFCCKIWQDGVKKIEEKLAEILAYIELNAKGEIEAEIEREKERIIRDERERLQQELIAKQDKELKMFKKALKLSKRYDNANKLRSYIDLLEQKSLIDGEIPFQTQEWIIWARKKADWYDPFIEAYDELLRGADREELVFDRKGN